MAFGIWVASIFQFSISYYLLAPKETPRMPDYTPLPSGPQGTEPPEEVQWLAGRVGCREETRSVQRRQHCG